MVIFEHVSCIIHSLIPRTGVWVSIPFRTVPNTLFYVMDLVSMIDRKFQGQKQHLKVASSPHSNLYILLKNNSTWICKTFVHLHQAFSIGLNVCFILF